jgi:hypothetical protein
VVAKPQAARPCNEDLIPPTRPTFRLHRAQCSKKNVLNVLWHEGCGAPTLTQGLAVKGRGCIGRGMLTHWVVCWLLGLRSILWPQQFVCMQVQLDSEGECGKAQQVCKSLCCNQPVLGKSWGYVLLSWRHRRQSCSRMC